MNNSRSNKENDTLQMIGKSLMQFWKALRYHSDIRTTDFDTILGKKELLQDAFDNFSILKTA